jgi:putative FmdB family regulatory protein|tara:strand:+ start:798 stop:1175 length:378 start_codon:yes stop_codon:yes gene_type:complete
MPVYLYRCRGCGTHGQKWQKHTEDPMVKCPECRAPTLRRVFSFAMKAMMHEHFDQTVGKVISDPKQFKEELRRASEKETERTGRKVNYVPVDLNDKESLRVTEEGMDSTLRRNTQTGKREVKQWL